MKVRSPLSFLFLALFLLTTTVAARPQDCRECGGVGLLPCPKHRPCGKDDSIDPHRRATFCNACLDCPECRGLEWSDCPDCVNEESEQWLAARQEGMVEAGKRAAPYEKFMERRLNLAESKHFLLICELKPRKVGRSKADEHQLLHIYLDRLESLFDDYCTILEAKEEEFEHRSVVMLWETREDHDKAGTEYCEWEWKEPFVNRRGSQPILSLHGGDKRFKKDEDLHCILVHLVVHALMNQQKPSLFTGDTPGGWADVGLPHWFTDKYFGTTEIYCHPQAQDGAVFLPGKWRQGVRKLVEGDKIPPIANFAEFNARALDGESHAVSFSLVDYMMARDPAKLNSILKRVRSRTPLRDSVKEIFGEKIEDFEKAWKEWVLDNYKRR